MTSVEPAYVLEHDSANATILPALSKRKRANESNGDAEEGDRPKKPHKDDDRGRARKSKEQQLSKTKRKKLMKILERKKKKASRESLLESLQEFQVGLDGVREFTSTAHMQDKKKDDHASVPVKLKSIAGSRRTHNLPPQAKPETRVWQTGTYYETDSSSDDENDSEIPVNVVPRDATASPSSTSTADDVVDVKKALSPEPDEVQIIELEHKPKVETSIEEEKQEQVEKPPTKEIKAMQAKTAPRVPAVHVPVNRTPEIQASRAKLPIFAEEQAIVEAIREHTVTVLCGETGSGKTTQVPQFLYEAGFATNGRVIGITEPRRVAAVSMAERVGTEMSLSKDIVSYQIRYEGNATEQTRILFMTDGVLLKELQRDIQLSRYSVIIIDEAHERSMYSDVLIGLLSRIAPMRARKGDPLKIIVMSATLRVDDFTQPRLFREPPLVTKVESRQFRVTIHFSRRTNENYLSEAYKKVCQIHRQLPDGGILVFVSGQQEVETLINWLCHSFPFKHGSKAIETKPKRVKQRKNMVSTPAVDLNDYSSGLMDDRGADLDEVGVGESLDLNDDAIEREEQPPVEPSRPLFCLPLYSMLPTSKQTRVFQRPPEGARLCVVATNVAETSLTIPDVRYVVDTGKEKARLHDPVTGVSQFVVRWTSQASANQRAGRAGRVGPGDAYRLYSSAVFNDEFERFSEPEVLNKPVDELVLQMKAMNIVKVRNFPFPTPPDGDAIDAGEHRLIKLGVLAMGVKGAGTETVEEAQARITSLGRTVSLFPVAPKFGVVLALADQYELLPYAVCLVAALSVREPLVNVTSIRGHDADETKRLIVACMKQRRGWAAHGQSHQLGDLMVLLKAVGAAEFEGMTAAICQQLGLHHKAAVEIRKLRKQLTDLINATCKLSRPLVLDAKMKPPTELQAKLLRQTMLAGLGDQVARRVLPATTEEEVPKGAYQTLTMKEFVFIHPTSVLFKDQPDFVIYQQLVDLSGKKCMMTLTAVEPEWLPLFAEAYCSFGNAVEGESPRYDREKDCVAVTVSATFGPSAWPLPAVKRPHPLNADLYRWFAVAFLDGTVCPSLEKYRSLMLASPSTMTKRWAKLQPRTEQLLNALIEHSVATAAALAGVWQQRVDYLLEEYCLWLPESLHDEIRLSWPPKLTLK